MKILYDNAVDRKLSITASTTAGSLAASNLLTEAKSEVWRSTGTTATLTTTWTNAEFVNCVVLPFCNLTSSATFRVKLYTNVADVSPVLDTGTVLACAAAPLGFWNWGNVPLGVNAYSYGGGNYGRAFFTSYPVKKVEVIITDSSNPSGYIEASRLVLGATYTPENDANLDDGVNFNIMDTTVNTRTGGGDLKSDIGTQSKSITFSLSHMSASDRNTVQNILKGNASYKPVFISLFPQDADPTKEQTYQIYGKLSENLNMGHAVWNLFNSQIEIKEM